MKWQYKADGECAPVDRMREVLAMEVAATAEKRVVTALKTRVEGPMAASWTILQHLPMQRVSIRDMKGSASGRTSVGSAKAMSAWIEGRASSSAASCKALSAGHVCGGVGKDGAALTARTCASAPNHLTLWLGR